MVALAPAGSCESSHSARACSQTTAVNSDSSAAGHCSCEQRLLLEAALLLAGDLRVVLASRSLLSQCFDEDPHRVHAESPPASPRCLRLQRLANFRASSPGISDHSPVLFTLTRST